MSYINLSWLNLHKLNTNKKTDPLEQETGFLPTKQLTLHKI
jgi:hypothetical protein